jgi:hypothetical protein
MFSLGYNQLSNMSRNESPVTVASEEKNGPCTFSRDTAQKTLTFGESRWCCICALLLGSPDKDIVSVHLATDVECGFIGKDQSL